MNGKLLLILGIALLMTLRTDAQPVSNRFVLTGMIRDSATLKPIELVTINLKNTSDRADKTVVSGQDGSFRFGGLVPGIYRLTLTQLGYRSQTTGVTLSDLTQLVVDLGPLLMAPQTVQLQSVTVLASKPFIKQEIDRISYDLQADPESKGSNVIDLLHKVPLLSVSADETLLLNGTANYRLLINGKPSGLLEKNPKELLRGMRASTVQRIDVMTNPPAQYDAEGLAGIINIVTIKSITNGFRGTLNLSERAPVGGPGLGGTISVRQGKFGLSVNGSVSLYNTPLTQYETRQVINDSVATSLWQQGSREITNTNGYLVSELSYELNPFQLLSAQVNLSGVHIDNANQQRSQLTDSYRLVQQYILTETNQANGQALDAALNYQLGFKADKNRLLTFSYRYTTNDNQQQNRIVLTDRINDPLPNYDQFNQGRFLEHTIQVDYIRPWRKLTVEAGLKGIWRTNQSTFQYGSWNSSQDQFAVDSTRSNHYRSDQQVISFYNTYQIALKRWELKAGFRLEETVINADFLSTASSVDQQYLNMLPSVYVNRKFDERSNINLSFSQRIQRPGIYQLNPFVDRSNPAFELTGNPTLRPAVSSNLAISYNRQAKKGTISLGLGYTSLNRLIGQVSAYHTLRRITQTRFENAGQVSAVNGNLFANYPITKHWMMNLNTMVRYAWIHLFVDGLPIQNEGFMSTFSLANRYNFSKGWRLNGNLILNGRNLSSLQGKTNAYVSSSFSVGKDVVENKLTFVASITNPLTAYRHNLETVIAPTFGQVNDTRMYFRSFSLSLNYNVGKDKNDIKRNRRGIRNDDVSTGGDVF